MIDRETGSVWTHLDGKATRGILQDARMTMIPVFHMTWGEWKGSHPDGMVLSPNTPFQDRLSPGEHREIQFTRGYVSGDDRLVANALVVGVEVNEQFKGYPLEELRKAGGVINDTLGGEPIVVFYDEDARMGLAYSRLLDDQVHLEPPGDSHIRSTTGKHSQIRPVIHL